MRNFLPAALLLCAGVFGLAFTTTALHPGVERTPGADFGPQAADIAWLTWDQAVKANAASPKPLIIDVYTDWCGWCKRMDATTFKDPRVTAYVADNFHAVKLDAEQKADIVYDGTTFSFQQQGQRGVHTLAASLLDGRLSYPSIVYLNGQMERTMISPGYKDADALLAELKQAVSK